MSGEEREFALDFGFTTVEVMGTFDRTRLDGALEHTADLIEGMGDWPWPGTVRDELAGLVAEAYAFGRVVAETDGAAS